MSFKYIRRADFAAALLFAPGVLDAFSQPTPGQTASAPVAKPLPFVSPIFGDNMVLQRGELDTKATSS
jgi:hypothetical protein